jgi:gliding motility-associated-like protein
MCSGETMVVNNFTYDENTPSGTETLTASNGCDSVITIDLRFVQPISVLIDDNLCKDDDMVINGITYDIGNPFGQNTLVSAAGCDSVITVDLTFTELELDIRSKSVCPEESTKGSIQIRAINSGVPPYSYTINEGTSASIDRFPMNITDLDPASYSINVYDAEGCSYHQNVTVRDVQRMDLNIEYVETGEGTYDLELQHTGSIDSFYWVTQGDLSCEDCMSPSIQIDGNTVITAVVIDENGCDRSVQILIEYKRGVQAEMANVLNTRSNVGNNRLYLTLENPEGLEYDIYVYSRWGDLIYQAQGLQPNDPSSGWDGTKGGKILNTGVYIYKIMITQNKEPLEIIHGDVTLID